jgi:D-alanyl-D-alanine endopeptidase (penicillin-binding protein 7)
MEGLATALQYVQENLMRLITFRRLGVLLSFAALPAVLAVDPSPVLAAGAATLQPASEQVLAAATKKRRRRRPALPKDGVYSRHAYLYDPSNGEVIFEKNADRSVPIASITKLMTAMVFLEQDPDLDREVVVAPEDLLGGGKTQLLRRERVKLVDLLHMALMCSDNVAARILAREGGLSHEDFLARMNTKAIEIGLTHSRFTEVTGLDVRNVSTAADVARLVQAACNQPRIRHICQTRSYDFRTQRRAHYIPNTNRMLYSQYEVRGGKTGYISAAGYCFATWVRKDNRDLIAVVLNAPTAATRFADVHRMLLKPAATTTASN